MKKFLMKNCWQDSCNYWIYSSQLKLRSVWSHLGVLKLLTADVGFVAGLDIVPGSDQFLGRHPAGHLVLVPGQPLEQTRLDVDLQFVRQAESRENSMTGLNDEVENIKQKWRTRARPGHI